MKSVFSTAMRQADLPSFGLDSAPLGKFRETPPLTVPDGAAYLTRTFACEAGSRDYKLYIPSHMDGRKLPLIPVAPPQRKRRFRRAKGRGRTIVFHGASDQTVHPSNGEIIFALFFQIFLLQSAGLPSIYHLWGWYLKTSRPNTRLQQSTQSPSLALFTPAKQSRQRLSDRFG